jgi:hypothetical protein
VVHVPDRAHVHVRLGALEFSFCHFYSPKSNARVSVLRLHHTA